MLKKVRRIAWLYSVCMGIGAMALHSCTAADRKTEDSELKAFHAFYAEKVDSISVNPRKVRTEVLQRMCNVRDSLVHYNYLALVLKTCLATSDIDSAGMLIRRIGDFTKRQPFSPQLADLQSENLNMEGNIYARTGYMDSAIVCFQKAYELAEQLCVTLAEELDFVKTYIDLERRSLGTDFHPVVEIGVDVYPEKVLLPSMLIQIPVENAIKHALRGKEGERNLWISACRQKDGIRIRITDNGGGYRLNSRNRGTGTGMKVVMQTIQILNRKNKEGIDVAIHNVTLPTGETGCEVTFLLPEKYNYNIEK
ncbi:MAG: hypothetical protein SPH57_16355 [Bacteroides helcogenes]|nr:ATP-binding protein [Bacteroides helcogenes]MDY5240011.1 hypothetical protein [Bacteroides helcogenes]